MPRYANCTDCSTSFRRKGGKRQCPSCQERRRNKPRRGPLDQALSALAYAAASSAAATSIAPDPVAPAVSAEDDEDDDDHDQPMIVPHLSSATSSSACSASCSSSSSCAADMHGQRGDRDDGVTTLLSQLRDSQREPELTDEEQQLINGWLRLCAFHNNYGSDFIDLDLHRSSALPSLTALLFANGMQVQSGPGTDDCTTANLLWTDLTVQCQDLFAPFTPLTAAAHSTDLLGHIVTAVHILRF